MAHDKPSVLLFFIFLATWGIHPRPTMAQSDPSGSKRVTDVFVITGATLIPSPGQLLEGHKILFEKGIIMAIGKDFSVPANAQEIKADSLFVYPGLIELANKTGVSKPKIPERPDDFDPSNPPAIFAGIHPYENVLDHYDPEFSHNAEWRKIGIVISHKIPMGEGFLPGQTALVVYGNPKLPNRVKEGTSLYARFHTVSGLYPTTPLGVMAKLRELMQNARLLEDHQRLFASQQGVRIPERNKVLEAFQPVVKGEKPLLFEVGSELDILKLLRLKEELNFDLILTGIDEGEALIPVIKKAGVGAVLTLNLPEDPSASEDWEESEDQEIKKRNERILEAYRDRLRLAGKYEEAGIPFAFSTKHLRKDSFYKSLRLLIENGLSQEGALSALTIHPAKMYGIDEIAGDLATGKMANMIITTDTLFSEDMQIKYVIADGYVFEYEPKEKETADSEETWKYETSTRAGKSTGEIFIKREQGKLKGKISYDDPEGSGKKKTDLKDLKVSSGHMSFDFEVVAGGNNLEIRVEGTISGGKFDGNMNILGFSTVPFKATKIENPKK
ncbi:amidohydrolase family protein [Pleomorphovibrio marinus]|uniref:amidohydrolase family protein n=1 Tax=Pleomorphovibrio marinus TaxID=2164132 RepID=UPI000E09FB85|nr:amidohydrolase family protein [Pleomorphovibrio marinus]